MPAHSVPCQRRPAMVGPMTAAPMSPEPAAVPGLFNAAVAREIHDALIDDERAEFEQRFHEVMERAGRTLDLAEVFTVLDAWREVAIKTQQHGVEGHRRMLNQVKHTLATGEPPEGSVDWDDLKAELGLTK